MPFGRKADLPPKKDEFTWDAAAGAGTGRYQEALNEIIQQHATGLAADRGFHLQQIESFIMKQAGGAAKLVGTKYVCDQMQFFEKIVAVARIALEDDGAKEDAIGRIKKTEAPKLVAAFLFTLGLLWRNLDTFAPGHPQTRCATRNSFMCFEAATEADPTCSLAFTYMGIIYETMGRYAGSAVFFGRARDAHSLTDIDKWLHSNESVSSPLLLLGETDAAVEVLETGMKKAAASRALGGQLTDSMFAGVNPKYVQAYLFALCMSSKTRDQVSEAHMEFGKLVRTLTGPLNPCVVEDKDPSRRLKIGYLSGNLCKHVVSDCLEGVLRAHDREAVQVTTYQRNSQDDATTATLRSLSDEWVKCDCLTPNEVNERIRSDHIDILIEIDGHTQNSQIPIMALCPAPIQVAWIGYPNTTGLDCVHYRITDAICDPVDSTQVYSEQLVRVPTFFNCLQKETMLHVLPAASPPIVGNGFCTFGSFNSLRKHSKCTKRTWGRLLLTMPDAMLMLKDKCFMHPEETERWTSAFIECACDTSIAGVNLKKRLRLIPMTPESDAHWNMYNEMDVMLDSWPYCGTVTSVECLMMGVPIVTLQAPGKDGCHSQNVTASILTQVGLSDLIAHSEEEYLQIAFELANNPDRLAQLKTTLRQKCRETICNPCPTTLCREVEAEFRKMWHKYIDAL